MLQRLFSLYSLMWNVQESPAQEGYRNKCEFTIGFHPVTLKLTVGFRLGQYASGLILVPAGIQCECGCCHFGR
jgi:tRNA/tmRNA/rRNA uracil-C5-methylase (TrmA/RlmC/RlmD family)